VPQRPRPFVLGYHAGPAGRAARLLLGISSVVTGGIWLTRHAPAWPVTVLALAAAVVFYLGIYQLVMWPPVAREPWLGTFAALAPLGVLGFAAVPPAARTGVSAYLGASLVVNAVTGYGGCEVVAVPGLVFGRRPTVYCPYNAIDAVERPLARDGQAGDRVWLAAAVLAVTVGAYFLFIGPLLGTAAGGFRPAAALLAVPAAVLGWRAWRGYRQHPRPGNGPAATALGALALLAMATVFAGLVSQDVVFGVIMLGGLVVAAVRSLRHRHRSGSPDTAPGAAS
jgi:hypothetical protein